MSHNKSLNKKIIGGYDEKDQLPLFTPAEEDLCKQSFGSECDINNIMSRYVTSGVIDHQNSQIPQFADYPAMDFQEAQNFIIDAQTSFDQLPAKLRAKFENNPYKMLLWVEDPANEVEGRAMGLLEALPEPIQKAAVLSPTHPPVDALKQPPEAKP